jgi:hypothetical protein
MDSTRWLRRYGPSACVLFALAFAPPVALGQAPANDLFGNARPLGYGTLDTAINNTGAGVEPGEIVACNTSDGHVSVAGSTVWWSLVGSGRTVTVTDNGSLFDTTLADTAGGPGDPSGACDDLGPLNESISFPTTVNQIYHVQVGGCVTLDAVAANCGAATGQVHLLATTPPPANDNRAAVLALPTGTPTAGDNFGATEEGGEFLSCATPTGVSPYAATVWYTWHAPAAGKAVFTAIGAGGLDTVMAVYRGGDVTPTACNDDPSRVGPSRIEMRVEPGDYMLQVGGYDARNVTYIPNGEGQMTVDTEFTANPPGAPAPPAPVPAPVLTPLAPKTVLPKLAVAPRAIWLLYDAVTGIDRLDILDVPAGARIELSCRGGGCPLRAPRVVKLGRQARRIGLLNPALKRARFRRGAVLKVVITKPGTIGRVVSWTFSGSPRRLRAFPVEQNRCLPPGARTPVSCAG